MIHMTGNMASVLIDRIVSLPKYMGEINAKSLYVGSVLKYRVLACRKQVWVWMT